jgi:predicted aspartyl protease
MSFKRSSVRHWVVGLGVLLCSPAVLADSCQLELISEVAMSVTKSGHVVVPVEIDGIRVRMAIDTASSLTNIYSGAMTELNLTPKDTIKNGLLSVGATTVTETVRIRSLKMANVNWPQVSALVYPWNKPFPPLLSEDEVVGSLGQNMFAGVDLELDFGAHKLRLYSQKHCPGKVVYWARSFDVLPLQKDRLGDSYIAVMANGKPMEANIATMDTISAMEAEAAEKVLGLDRSTAGVDATGGSDGCAFCGSITLKAQGLEIQNARVKMVKTVSPGCHFRVPNIFGAPANYDCAGAFPLHIGMNVLTKLHLYYANGEKKLYFTDADVNAASAGTQPNASTPPQTSVVQ